MVQVGMASSTTRQILFSSLAKSVGHAPRCTTRITFHPQILRLQRGPTLEEAQRAFARTVATMNEIVPRKVVEVPIAAGQQETRRHGVSIPGRLVALRTPAALMDEPGSFGPEAVLLDRKNTRLNSRP